MTAPPLIVTATPREAHALGNGAVACGAGEHAGVILDALLRGRMPRFLLIAGVCGGLDPSLAPGDLVLARRVAAPGRDELFPSRAAFDAVRHAMRTLRLSFISSSLLTLARPASTRSEKTRLWNTHGAGAVDMESYAMARAADVRGVPWLALRAVLDPAWESLPPSLRGWDGEKDGDVARRLMTRPLEWPACARLALQMRRATRSLRAVLPVALNAEMSLIGGKDPEIPLVVRA